MEFVFVVVEKKPDEELKFYPQAYTSFSLAGDAVKSKYKEDLLEQQDENGAETALKYYRNPSYVYIEKGIHIYIMKLPIKQGMAWTQDEDCVGEEDPVSLTSISSGRGFKLEAENRCYDVETLAQMKRVGIPLIGPLTRNPFTDSDIMRIDNYLLDNPTSIGGKKTLRKTKKGESGKTKKSGKGKTGKTGKTKKTRK